MGVKFALWHYEKDIQLRVFENRVLGRIFGLKRDEIIDWKKLHYKDLPNFYFSPNILVTGMKSYRMRQEEHVAHIDVRRVHRHSYN
jgi:hypothetical protein